MNVNYLGSYEKLLTIGVMKVQLHSGAWLGALGH